MLTVCFLLFSWILPFFHVLLFANPTNRKGYAAASQFSTAASAASS